MGVGVPLSPEMTTWQCIKYILCWPFQRQPRNVLAWLLVVIVCWNYLFCCLRINVDGHITCDFAGQWMHGRAFFKQECDRLYYIDAGKEWLADGFEQPKLDEMIGDILKKGRSKEFPESGIEGPLYPPTASMLFSVLAPYKPQTAHALAIYSYLLMGIGCGWMISQITRGRLQTSEAALMLLLFPNNYMGLMLGQNQMLTLTIIVGGWYCFSKGLPLVGGLVWGLLAYKPVFAVALILVPIALPSLRMLIGMGLGGFVFVLATLPFTHGPAPWFRWLEVGKRSEHLYTIDRNWIWMSRDLVGLPRRKMWDAESLNDQVRYNIGVWQPGARWGYVDKDGDYIFAPAIWLFWHDKFDENKHQHVYQEWENGVLRSTWWPNVVGWSLLGGVAGITVLLGWLTGRAGPMTIDPRQATGPRAVFLLTGGLLCVYHFMHYDLVTFALPVILAVDLMPRWGWLRRSLLIAGLTGLGFCMCGYMNGGDSLRWPWETFLLIILWLWMAIETWVEHSRSRE